MACAFHLVITSHRFKQALTCINNQFFIFVEVVYDPEHNVITELKTFKTGHLLDKYSIDF